MAFKSRCHAPQRPKLHQDLRVPRRNLLFFFYWMRRQSCKCVTAPLVCPITAARASCTTSSHRSGGEVCTALQPAGGSITFSL
ncbi:hypothetical protein E2C01_088989 [Portunus trituberculatus]|uniref:Uncharacterized protein n=1 Tax=Portunus trituberculatus TaxID=210409 RepID=A0A5B7JND1_PORTR|nr:hypothetical protein [Portunus trituberculatus]